MLATTLLYALGLLTGLGGLASLFSGVPDLVAGYVPGGGFGLLQVSLLAYIIALPLEGHRRTREAMPDDSVLFIPIAVLLTPLAAALLGELVILGVGPENPDCPQTGSPGTPASSSTAMTAPAATGMVRLSSTT